MKELISSIAALVFLILFVAFVICIASHIFLEKRKTSRHCKTIRNLAALMCICALLSCLSLSSFGFHGLFYPLLAVPTFLVTAIEWHQIMKIVQEEEEIRAAFMKTQPIDVEFKELN